MKKRTLGGLGKNEPKRTQTKPISEKPKMSVNKVLTKDYENIYPCGVPKNKPNSNPIPQKAKMNVTSLLTKDYTNHPPMGNKSNQTQFQTGRLPINRMCHNNAAKRPQFGLHDLCEPTAVPRGVPFDLRAKPKARYTAAYSLQCWHRWSTLGKMDGHNNRQSTGRRGHTESPEHNGVMREASDAT